MTTPAPKPGLFNNISDYTEEEVRRVQTHGFMPDDAELADDFYALDAISRKMTERTQPDAENSHHDEPSSSSTENEKKATNGDAPPPPGGPHAPIAGEKVNIWHPAVSSMRLSVAWDFLKVWVLLGCLVIVTFSIYWGSLYDRVGHQKNLKMIVVIEDDLHSGIYPTIGESVAEFIKTSYAKYGNWKIINGTDEINDFFGSGKNVSAEVLREVHHRHYWSGTYIHANATLNHLDFLKGDTETAPVAVQCIYETGRDPVAMTPYVVTTLKNIYQSFQTGVWGNMTQQMISKLSDDEKLTLIESSAITTPPTFQFIDYRPFSNYTLIAPIQVGLIYLIIMSFFLFNFFAQIHLVLLPHIKIQQYLFYRVASNHLSYLIISLFVCAVSAIFQIDFTPAFGRGGFVVFWLTTYLTMAAVGGANENMGMLIFAHNPPFLGFWLITFVILNVSPSFSPLALVSPFYRYGYMFPIHHSNEIYKVIFLDVWKGQLGMNYGVIAAWVVINTLLMPLVLRHVGTVMANKARAAALAAEKK